MKQRLIRWVVPVALLTAFWVWQSVEAGRNEGHEIGYSALYQLAAEGKVERVAITGQAVIGELKAEEPVEGKTLTLTATALEKGGVTTPLEQRPAIEWNEKVNALGAGPASTPAAAPAATATGSASSGGASGSVNIGGGK